MEFYYRTFFSDELRDKKARLIRKLTQNKVPKDVYILTLAQGKQNHLEFFPSWMLKQKIFQTADLFIVGIASDYNSALYLVEQITDEVYQKTGDADIRSYIVQEQSAYKEGKRTV